jgi:hypothetical protein
MTKIRVGVFDDFKRIVSSRKMAEVYMSRQVFEENVPTAPAKPGEPPTAQRCLVGYVHMASYSQNGDVVRYSHLLPAFPNDGTDKRIKEIRAKIDEVENTLQGDMEQLQTSEYRIAFYTGEIEEDRAVPMALSQIAAVLKAKG